MFENFKVEEVLKNNYKMREKIAHFLREQELDFEQDIEYSVVILDQDVIIATGSFVKNVIKCIAVNDNYQGYGISEKIISRLISRLFENGEDHIFVVTKKANKKIFEGLGFGLIAEATLPFILMEYPQKTVDHYLQNLGEKIDSGFIGSIVLNANPFTLGHQHLVEYAAKQCDILHLFVVSENKSVFPEDIRYRLVQEGTKQFENVILHKCGEYMISRVTFPTYFLKDKGQGSRLQAEIDMDFFCRHIVPCLGINKRFVGEEPYCKTTLLYNQVMKQRLEQEDILFEEIKRFKIDKQCISASFVRQLIAKGNIEQVKQFVPESTYRFLISKESKNIINQIQQLSIYSEEE